MKKTFIWAVLTLFLMWFFYAAIPVDIYAAWSTPIFLLAGILTAITSTGFLVRLLVKRENVKTNSNEVDKGDNSGFLIAGVFILFLFGFPIFLIFHEIEMESNEFSYYGEFSYGHIVDGSSFKTRKADFTNLTIQYLTKDGVRLTEKCDISASEFEKYYLNQEVPIVYSKRYPSFFKVLRGDNEIAKYSKTKIRNITLTDLISLFDKQNSMEVIATLDAINIKWENENSEQTNTTIYTNNLKNIAIKITANKNLVYLHNNASNNLFEDEIKKMGFVISTQSKTKGTLYTNGKYIINKYIERIKGNDPNEGILDYKQLTIVEIVKLNFNK